MKYLLAFSIFAMSFSAVLSANEDALIDSMKGKSLRPEYIVVHPQPLTVGDAFISLKVPGKIVSTSIYTVTGERILKEYHNSTSTAVKYIPYNFRKGEYLLKVTTEDGVGLRRIFIR
jgi:hypothetical protein